MAIKLDLTQSRTLPDGIYELVIIDAETKPSQSSDFDYIQWTMKVFEGPKANEEINEITSLSPKALFRLKALAIAAKGDEYWPDEDDTDDFDLDPKDFFGDHVLADITTETYEGQKRNRVKKFYSIDDKEEVIAKAERGGRGSRR